MEAARVLPLSVADYLAFEETSAVRHEYIGGEIHAMFSAIVLCGRLSPAIA